MHVHPVGTDPKEAEEDAATDEFACRERENRPVSDIVRDQVMGSQEEAATDRRRTCYNM